LQLLLLSPLVVLLVIVAPIVGGTVLLIVAPRALLCTGQLPPWAPEPDTPLGEVWFAESPYVDGPWEYAVKVISHNNTGMSFYNPTQVFVPTTPTPPPADSMAAAAAAAAPPPPTTTTTTRTSTTTTTATPALSPPANGSIFLSGTFSSTFSRNSPPVPRYEYNNIIYELAFRDLPEYPVAHMLPCPLPATTTTTTGAAATDADAAARPNVVASSVVATTAVAHLCMAVVLATLLCCAVVWLWVRLLRGGVRQRDRLKTTPPPLPLERQPEER
jgi:hypothetical protein